MLIYRLYRKLLIFSYTQLICPLVWLWNIIIIVRKAITIKKYYVFGWIHIHSVYYDQTLQTYKSLVIQYIEGAVECALYYDLLFRRILHNDFLWAGFIVSNSLYLYYVCEWSIFLCVDTDRRVIFAVAYGLWRIFVRYLLPSY